ncbi:hypothetical protein VTP01DRAFT_9836 [Rhizomucor pusillus]|uniref:uncharacterized protein n=1 Tax=Rhizomucor pusillus TaxID=4840 RepID=UPI0037439863
MATTIATHTATNLKSQHAPPASQAPSLHLISSSLETPTQQGRREDAIVIVLQDLLCHFALYIVHIAFLIYTACRVLRKYIDNHISCSGLHSNHVPDRSRILHDKARLVKIPKHLSFLISRELAIERSVEDWEMLVNDICLATCWAWEFGIHQVSVFDASGELQSMTMDICKQQYNTLFQWIKSSQSASSSDEISKSMALLKFRIVTPKEGRPQIAKVTQDIAKHLQTTGGSSDDIDIGMVDKFVHKDSISDPDLMLVCDGLPHNYISLDGFPPWHIRLTEFLNESTSHRIDYALISRCLYRYSKVEQRFGH